MTGRPPDAGGLYAPLDFFVVRVPLLPVEAYRELGQAHHRDAQAGRPGPDGWSSLRSDADVRRALAVGSLGLLDAFDRTPTVDGRRSKVESGLLRYLIRMSTRPTPFGLFAGVGLGGWGDRTNLTLAASRRPQRTRPDMAWLLRQVFELESDPEVRRRLQVVAHPAALIRAGRVFLPERAPRGEPAPPGVSIRATPVVRRALHAAREPIPFEELASIVLAGTPGASAGKVESLLAELVEHTLLLTDLRPPLTVERPVAHVLDRLAGIPAAAETHAQITSVVDAAAAWDASVAEDGTSEYRGIVERAGNVATFERSPLQVDAAVRLTGDRVTRVVALEAARAAELLMRLSPAPYGPARLGSYRRLFLQRYGVHREVPLLELLDPGFGLGSPWAATVAPPSTPSGISAAHALRRNEALLELATNALRERTPCIELDAPTIERLATWEPSGSAPLSIDLSVSVAARSAHAIDAGEFLLVIGPSVGALAAGRTLGRFADLVPGATDALARVAAAEAALAPTASWAELAYLPRSLRLANVSIRPNVRPYEISVGTTAGRDADHVVPLDELVVGVRDDRLYVRWTAREGELRISAGHMLSPQRAPEPCRFLSEVGRDGRCQLTGFQWGPASTFPFLPRVQRGRIVLAPAQWRLARRRSPGRAFESPRGGATELAAWRDRWLVPDLVSLVSGDNRLLLDLSDADQADELRRSLMRLGNDEAVTVTEVLPALDEAWARDGRDRRYMTELVIPLVRRAENTDAPAFDVEDGAAPSPGPRRPDAARGRVDMPGERLRPPGSDWVFAKLYGGAALEDDLLAGPIRDLVGEVRDAGLADDWFFIRYSDPERHLRLRFRGSPERLHVQLLPLITTWAGELIRQGVSQRLAFDTYEREIERFGGIDGMRAAETFFAADSQAVVDILDLVRARDLGLDGLPLAVLTADALLGGLGVPAGRRAAWCRRRMQDRAEGGAEYRRWKHLLRPLLSGGDRSQPGPGEPRVTTIVTGLREAAAAYRTTLDGLEARGLLERPAVDLDDAILHLHLNRLLGADALVERRVIALLGRVRAGLDETASMG